eukprot:SAG11_NODE_12517_length_699_cov_1.183333_1_plen_226_part_01
MRGDRAQSSEQKPQQPKQPQQPSQPRQQRPQQHPQQHQQHHVGSFASNLVDATIETVLFDLSGEAEASLAVPKTPTRSHVDGGGGVLSSKLTRAFDQQTAWAAALGKRRREKAAQLDAARMNGVSFKPVLLPPAPIAAHLAAAAEFRHQRQHSEGGGWSEAVWSRESNSERKEREHEVAMVLSSLITAVEHGSSRCKRGSSRCKRVGGRAFPRPEARLLVTTQRME